MIGGGRLVLQRQIAGGAGDPGSGTFLTHGVLRKFSPDGLLKIHGSFGGDGKNLRETQLADDLHQLIVLIIAAGLIGKNIKHSCNRWATIGHFSYYNLFRSKTQVCLREKSGLFFTFS